MGLLSWLGLGPKPRTKKRSAAPRGAAGLAGWLGKRVKVSARAGVGEGLHGEVIRVELDKIPIGEEILVRLDDGRGLRTSSNWISVERGGR